MAPGNADDRDGQVHPAPAPATRLSTAIGALVAFVVLVALALYFVLQLRTRR
jgi:hypothetical protein